MRLEFEVEFSDEEDFIDDMLEEVEYSYFVTRGLYEGIELLNNSLIEENNSQQKKVLILSLVFIFIVVIGFLVEGLGQIRRVIRRFQLAKQFIYMLPMYTVIIDESLTNKYRALIKKLKLMS